MTDPLTTNKSFDLPTTGEYPNAWGPVNNGNFSAVDTALGGFSSITVTGVSAGTYTLILSEYAPPNIKFIGTIGGNLVYQLPSNVGGFWSLHNEVTGAFTLSFASSAGSITLPQGTRTAVICDGANMEYWQTTASAGTPTALVGTSAVTGSATTFLASDSAPAIDQTMAPTWSGVHTFTGTPVFKNGYTLQGTGTLSGGATLDARSGTLECATASPGTASNVAASTGFVATSFATLASPPLTGVPTAPTAANGTDTTQIATTAFAYGTFSAGSPGYQKFPSGMIMQWGRSAGGASPQSVSFPIAFPNACSSITCTPSSSSTMSLAVSNPSSSTTGFTITATDVDPCSWIAIGF